MAKILQDAKVIHYPGIAVSQLPEFLQLQAVEFQFYIWAAKLLMGLNEQYTLQYSFTKGSFLNRTPCFGDHICFTFQNLCFCRKHN